MSKVTIEITEEAADCLAYWAAHWAYEGTFSEVILKQMNEWICREYASRRFPIPTVKELVAGCYAEMKEKTD